MPDWTHWANDALGKLDDTDEEHARAKPALEHVRDTGFEPYYTLKAFVHLDLESDT